MRRIERIFFGVGFVWAMASWPLAEALDGLRLLLTVVSVAGLLVMANTTCFAPRVFRASVIGFGLGIGLAIPAIKTIPWYVLAGATTAFLIVVTGVGAGTARQLIHMLRMQVERDEAIECQKRTIAALDSARRAATSLAETDNLTGLPNRFLFMTKLDALIASEEPFSLTLLDIDLFKNINDGLGHNIGDEALKAVGGVLATCEEQHGFAARLGGDEFAVIAIRNRGEKSGTDCVAWVNERIGDLRTSNLKIPSISITGGSTYFPQDANNRSDLLAAADMAQREAKKTRRGGNLDYSANLTDTFRRETRIAQALNEAIAARSLSICFQPKINLQAGRVEGAEALSRFPESLAGYSLDEIFEVAEKRGLGTILDELVLDAYREALVALRDEFSISLPTSVNLSGAILKAPERLFAKLNMLIAEGLSPALIRIEITENAVYGRGQIGVIKLLDDIVKLGFSLALDDFGTGGGTLLHLVNLPISEIKIDRSFVSGMLTDRNKNAIISGLIVTGQGMGVDIVAEGVETEKEANRLRSMGARFAQGFLWSKPLPLSRFADFVRLFGPGVGNNPAIRPEAASARRPELRFAGRA
ncbi:bifunctional diguanylate cyclase/phosphodiesterase [Rhodoblastus acidophilus]|uniref:Bifunctional diguanylate cyclase/phosphodiesterase n=1 Tax=Candidatus Rhodoblastus alkanivorans TaxID=2954117 RepID=A0ABS9Z5X6_9HYPH|nr:bifunctional diguanylate cyclase/phosphodiesterase [Candidatus Rhodoblastus alkanivorans]MCI4677676.1 bifunctional diguanylate cyclase/phosphodiesterase [Candidatus Rhodoblastus alkanivorans]MCI4682592.1 bifunctional diguanylate cyclase/phosphodiesterase [Candidatus Rhodoblastus alkanivorans]MDI4639898.1 bifunctional diguanylate cyclase/phosphodiesterase [Rhodoblastus acidophilus]